MGEIDFLSTIPNKKKKPSAKNGYKVDYRQPEPEKKPQPVPTKPKVREDKRLSWWQKRKLKKADKKKKKIEEKQRKSEDKKRKKERPKEEPEKIVEKDIELLDPEMKGIGRAHV